jgi:uncharacterized protein YcfL
VRRLAPLLLLAGLAACEAPAALPRPGDPRVILTPVVAQNLAVSEPSVSTLPDGRMRVVVNIQNPAPSDFPLRMQTDWLDSGGRPLPSVANRPVFRSIARSTVTTIDADAPNARARDFRMTLDIESP